MRVRGEVIQPTFICLGSMCIVRLFGGRRNPIGRTRGSFCPRGLVHRIADVLFGEMDGHDARMTLDATAPPGAENCGRIVTASIASHEEPATAVTVNVIEVVEDIGLVSVCCQRDHGALGAGLVKAFWLSLRKGGRRG